MRIKLGRRFIHVAQQCAEEGRLVVVGDAQVLKELAVDATLGAGHFRDVLLPRHAAQSAAIKKSTSSTKSAATKHKTPGKGNGLDH